LTLGNQEFYLVILFDILLLAGFITGYYVPAVRKIPKKGKKLQNEEIEKLKRKMGVDADVYVISSKNMSMNAFQIGGKGRYVVLSSILLENLNENEVLAVLAHEFSHMKLRHVLKNLIIVYLILAVGINSLFIPMSTLASAIILVSIFPIALGINILLKRKFDYEADSYAIKFVNPKSLVSALRKINAAIYPSFMVEKGKMHPLIKKRIEAIENGGGTQKILS